MDSLKSGVLIAVTAFFVLVPLTVAAAPLPAGTKAVPAAELKKIFTGKSQALSANNATYFAANGTATYWARMANFSTNAKWTATDGRICVDGTFQSLGDIATKQAGTHEVRCWDLQQGNGDTYQRVAGDGSKPSDLAASDWAIFQSAKSDPKDLINMMKDGDTASPKVKEFMAYLTAPAPVNPKLGQKLNGAAIKAGLFGHLSNQVNSPNNFNIKVDVDGATAMRNGETVASTGVSRVINDMYCLHSPLTAVERCFLIYKDGDTYSYAFVDGVLNFSFTLK